MITRKATAAEVRKFYKDEDHTVRISRDGHVNFKRNGDGPWLEGRWVSDYVTDEAWEENGRQYAAQTSLH